LRIIISHIALLFFSLNSLAQTFEVTNYNAADYLGRSNIYDFTQDEFLNFYLGTDNGILKFDGYQFSEFNVSGIKDDLKINKIQYVQDHLFIATKDRLYLYSFKNDSLSIFYAQGVNSIQISGENIYILTKNKLLHTPIGDLSKLNTLYENTSVIFNTAFVTDSTKIIGSSEGLFINKQPNIFEQTGSFVDVQAIYENYDSSLLVLGKHKIFKYAINKLSQQLSF